MKSFIKKISHRILVISMITIVLSFFSVSSVSQAKLSLDDSEFYYTGTQNSEVMWEEAAWRKLVNKLSQIPSFLTGLLFLSIRSVFVGWIEIFEILLTTIVGENIDWQGYISESLAGLDTYSQHVVNVERIIFNKVELFNIDMFGSTTKENDNDPDNQIDTAGEPIEEPKEPEEELSRNQKILKIMREAVAKWYVTLRLIVIAIMLLLLIFIGIKMAIATVASEKAVYKKMLLDWVTGIIIIFSIHYIMALIIVINNTVVDALGNADFEETITQPYEYGDDSEKKKKKSPTEVEFTLYESARTRAYSMSPLDGFAGMIIYGALVYYAWKFALIYFRRLLNIMILTIVSPIIAGTYAFNKTLSGGATIYSNWLKEYIINVILQVFHAIIYLTLVSTAFNLALESLLGVALAVVLLSFMSNMGQLLRQLFNISGGSGSLFEEMSAHTDFKTLRSTVRNLPTLMLGGAMGKKAAKATLKLATKVPRKATEVVFSKYMMHKANKKGYKNARKEKKEANIKKMREDFENSPEVVNKRNELESREEALYNKKEKIKTEKDDIKKKLASATKNGEQDKIDDLTSQLKAKEKEEKDNDIEIQKNRMEINDFEDSVNADFIDYYVRSQSTWETIRDNIGNLFDPENYLDKEDISIEEIDEKASEMFSDFDKYKEIIKNKGKTKDEAEMFKEYSDLKAVFNRRQKLMTNQNKLNKIKDEFGIQLSDLQIQLDAAKKNNDIDKINELNALIDDKNNEIEENKAALLQNQNDLKETEDEAKDMYIQYFPENLKINENKIKNDVNLLFNKIDERVEELEEKLELDSVLKEQEHKDNLKDAYDNIEAMREEAQKALTKYKYKKIKREGGVEGAFWRKKESSIGKIFFDNAKLDKILGITSDEKKILKAEFDDVKSTLLGAASGIAGFALIGGNASLGMALLANNFNSKINSLAKTLTLKGSPSRLKYNYKFKKFGEGSSKVINSGMEREIKFAESKMTRINVQKHPVLKKILDTTDVVVKPVIIGTNVFSGVVLGAHIGSGRILFEDKQPYESIPNTRYTRNYVGVGTLTGDKLDDLYQKKARKIIKQANKELVELNTKSLEDEYKEENRKYRKKLIDETQNQSTEDLILEDVLASDDVIKVGDTIIEFNDSDMKKIEFGDQALRTKKVEECKKTIKENKDKFIQMAIFELAIEKKVTNIEELFLDDLDRAAIRNKIKEKYERKGYFRKSELKIDKIIVDEDINAKLTELTKGKESANDKIANIIVKKACFGYMVQNNISNPEMLKSSQAQTEIATMIEGQFSSKTSKSTQNVLNQMTVGNRPQSSTIPHTLFSISNIEAKIEEATKKMKKKTVQQVNARAGMKYTKRQLIERSVVRKENQMKKNLENAVYTGEDSRVTDEAQLRMLFLLSEMESQNKLSYKVEGKKTKKTKEQTLREVRYKQYQINPDRYSYDEEETQMPLGDDQINVSLHGRRDIIDIINNG